MHIIGNSPKSAYLSTNKYAMREVFQTYGLLCPAFKKITLENGCPINRGKLSYPIIVKPCDRSGSLGVTKVFNNYELNIAIDNALSVSLCKEVVVEEFIDGKFEVSVECITWLGEHHIITVTDKETSGYPNFVELAHHQPSMLPNDIISIIKEETIKGLNAMEHLMLNF
jgi:carbamoylphosphate synthase large subunit